jgi:bifunctional DNase/RNase
VLIAASTSHSVLIFSGADTGKERIINQRPEHASAAAENFTARNFGLLVFPFQTDNVAAVNKTVIEVQVRAVLPTSGGCAVFLGNNDKVFIIYVDQTVGSAITMFMRDISKERPLTHDLMGHLMTALGAHVERIIINDLKNATYYARMIICAENEVQQKKIIELDARPSDCIAVATQQKAPIYVSQEVWDEVDDMTDVLRKMEEEGLKPDPETESSEEE